MAGDERLKSGDDGPHACGFARERFTRQLNRVHHVVVIKLLNDQIASLRLPDGARSKNAARCRLAGDQLPCECGYGRAPVCNFFGYSTGFPRSRFRVDYSHLASPDSQESWKPQPPTAAIRRRQLRNVRWYDERVLPKERTSSICLCSRITGCETR